MWCNSIIGTLRHAGTTGNLPLSMAELQFPNYFLNVRVSTDPQL